MLSPISSSPLAGETREKYVEDVSKQVSFVTLRHALLLDALVV